MTLRQLLRWIVRLGLLALVGYGIWWGVQWLLYGAYSPHGSAVKNALRLAAAYWGENPCARRLELQGSYSPRAGMRAGLAGEAWPGKCKISLNAENVNGSWPLVCSTVVHEVGHLVGFGHSSRPGSVMQPTILKIPQCAGSDWKDTRSRQARLLAGKRRGQTPVRFARAQYDLRLRVYEDQLLVGGAGPRLNDEQRRLLRGARGGCGPNLERVRYRRLSPGPEGATLNALLRSKRQTHICALRGARGKIIAQAQMR